MTPTVTELLADPRRADDAPDAAVPTLLAAVLAEQGRLATLAATLAKRLGVVAVAAPGTRRRGEWLRIADAAEQYGLRPATLYDWVYKRRVVTKKVGTAKSSPVLLWRPDIEKRIRLRPALRARLDE